jgi:hypothetical protein
VIFDERRHHEGWRLIEVYDDARETRRIEIAAEEALAPRRRIRFVYVGLSHGVEYRSHMTEHLRSASDEVLFGAFVEYHSAAVGIGCLTEVVGHGYTLRVA